jgi:hypothetical protein
MVMVFLRDRFKTDDEVEDGRSVRVPMMIMDGYRPGYVQLTDVQIAKRREARDEMIKRGERAWRTPHRDAAEPDLGSRPEQLTRRYLWGKPDDDGAPDPGDPSAVMRRHLTERDEQAQRERDLAWTRYRESLRPIHGPPPRSSARVSDGEAADDAAGRRASGRRL